MSKNKKQVKEVDEIPLEVNESTQPLITEVDESNLVQALEAKTKKELDIVEQQTDRKTTVDSITTTVPSSTLNSPQRNLIERNRAEAERLRRRNLGY